jgi:hypothetical protein
MNSPMSARRWMGEAGTFSPCLLISHRVLLATASVNLEHLTLLEDVIAFLKIT